MTVNYRWEDTVVAIRPDYAQPDLNAELDNVQTLDDVSFFLQGMYM